MNDIKEIEIDNERIYLKKSKVFGWNVIYPIKINDKYNWKNFLYGGNIFKIFWIIVIVLFVLTYAYEYSHNLNFCFEFIEKYNVLVKRYGSLA